MNKTQLALSAIVLGAGVLLVTASGALAYRGDLNVQGPNYSPERHEAMTKAFENKDYNAWKELMQGKGRVTQVVNEGNFARFAEAHKLALEGKTEEAKNIRTELGLGLRNGSGQGQGMGYGRMANR
jgi:outer membrane translocation and assembly module TamA